MYKQNFRIVELQIGIFYLSMLLMLLKNICIALLVFRLVIFGLKSIGKKDFVLSRCNCVGET